MIGFRRASRSGEARVLRASACQACADSNASPRSSARRTSRTFSATPSWAATACSAGRWNVPVAGSHRTATRTAVGAAAFSSSSRFALSSDARMLIPVTLPPGWARFATFPSPARSSVSAMMGVVDVACRAARINKSPIAMIASNLSRASSAARAGKRRIRHLLQPHLEVDTRALLESPTGNGATALPVSGRICCNRGEWLSARREARLHTLQTAVPLFRS